MDFKILEFLLKRISSGANKILTHEQESKATQYYRYGYHGIEIEGSKGANTIGRIKDLDYIRKQFLIKGTDLNKLLYTQKSLITQITYFNTEDLINKWRNLLIRSLLLTFILFAGIIMIVIDFRVIGLLLIAVGVIFFLGLLAYYKLFVSLKPDNIKPLLNDMLILEQAKIAVIQTESIKNENERNAKIDTVLSEFEKINYE